MIQVFPLLFSFKKNCTIKEPRRSSKIYLLLPVSLQKKSLKFVSRSIIVVTFTLVKRTIYFTKTFLQKILSVTFWEREKFSVLFCGKQGVNTNWSLINLHNIYFSKQ